jgi:DNA-binding XRE family transcriptional regulator
VVLFGYKVKELTYTKKFLKSVREKQTAVLLYSEGENREENKMITGKMLKVIRASRGINQQELASLMGFNQSYIAQLEKGKKPMTRKLDTKIKLVLNLTDEDLLNTIRVLVKA